MLVVHPPSIPNPNALPYPYCDHCHCQSANATDADANANLNASMPAATLVQDIVPYINVLDVSGILQYIRGSGMYVQYVACSSAPLLVPTVPASSTLRTSHLHTEWTKLVLAEYVPDHRILDFAKPYIIIIPYYDR